eukprot:CAMPEP_0174252258 /NCGR_PEP_ID=MMETSP0439-20130205/1809_1 /TAXON_ID=0 /ORGANISM="Stereomyxa ramosa, Strain Chinc5" /LENGTH=382 /DNA_ID=CAMNT_0015332771 /DNA_START=295 /DNA_END=1439 /DNA_ORIENTATION=+
MKIYHELGIAPDLLEVGNTIQKSIVSTHKGQSLTEVELWSGAKKLAPEAVNVEEYLPLSIPVVYLHHILMQWYKECLPANWPRKRIEKRAGITKLRPYQDQPTENTEEKNTVGGSKKTKVYFDDGLVPARVFDLVVSADAMWSPNVLPEFAEEVYRNKDKVTFKYADYGVWTTVVETPTTINLGDMHNAVEMVGIGGLRLGKIPISEEDCYFWLATPPEDGIPTQIFKSGQREIKEFPDTGSLFNGYGVDKMVAEVAEHVEEHCHVKYPKDMKAKKWTNHGPGSDILIGQAAYLVSHSPMYEIGLEVEDGYYLAKCLAEPGVEVQKALSNYCKLRKPRVEKVQEAALVAGQMSKPTNRMRVAYEHAKLRLSRRNQKLINEMS